MTVQTVYGVDFSGAKLAGKNVWIATCTVSADPSRGRLELAGLDRLESLAGTAERDAALAHLVSLIRRSTAALWGIDFPFGLPVELFGPPATWADQLQLVQNWPDGANAFGHWCLARAKALGGANHIRRATDVEQRTPFDCYHYRIIYQTFHGMRDVLGPIHADPATAVPPFQMDRVGAADRVVVEACPSSTLKRLGWPHQNYKQPAGGPLTPKRRRTRRVIVDALCDRVAVPDTLRRRMTRNPGGDAIDAVLAAMGVWDGWRAADLQAVADHPRYAREGLIFA